MTRDITDHIEHNGINHTQMKINLAAYRVAQSSVHWPIIIKWDSREMFM